MTLNVVRPVVSSLTTLMSCVLCNVCCPKPLPAVHAKQRRHSTDFNRASWMERVIYPLMAVRHLIAFH